LEGTTRTSALAACWLCADRLLGRSRAVDLLNRDLPNLGDLCGRRDRYLEDPLVVRGADPVDVDAVGQRNRALEEPVSRLHPDVAGLLLAVLRPPLASDVEDPVGDADLHIPLGIDAGQLGPDYQLPSSAEHVDGWGPGPGGLLTTLEAAASEHSSHELVHLSLKIGQSGPWADSAQKSHRCFTSYFCRSNHPF
jgi:hypothetical protein